MNKLAEYLTANATRRKAIVKDAKYPSAFITTRYKEAREIMKAFIIRIHDNNDVLSFIEELEIKETTTDFQENDRTLSIVALKHLLKADLNVLNSCELTLNENYENLMSIQGVDISVFPDVFLKKSTPKGDVCGAVKLHISKDNALSEEAQKIVGVLLHSYADAFLKSDSLLPSTKLCFSLDIFNEKMYCCPDSYKARLTRIEAACEEIALWWEKL